jgi:cytolysin-activating lysine-acyltransferase
VALGHIEQFVVPPLLSGQFAVMDTQIHGQMVPVAVASWVYVSPEVDQRLSDSSIEARLSPSDWRSGDLLWLIELVGLPRAARPLMQHLKEKVFAGYEVKMRQKTTDGHLTISELSSAQAY